MSRIFAPEFRGNIRRCVALPSLGPGPTVLTLFLLVSPSFTIAEKRPFFSRVGWVNCAAPFALPDLDGRRRSLAAERGRPVVVHFFATWCEPCKAELGTLRQFSEARGDKLGVLAVSVGEVADRVRSFFKETPVSFPVLLDADRSVAKAWAVDGLPTTVVLDKSLEPILAVIGDLDWASPDVGAEIEEALATNSDSRGATCTREDDP
jgi:thiol-disulfide isomerase/thioredoxin